MKLNNLHTLLVFFLSVEVIRLLHGNGDLHFNCKSDQVNLEEILKIALWFNPVCAQLIAVEPGSRF